MAQQMRYIDDRERHDNHATVEADEHLTFSVDGVTYAMDLTAANAERFRKELAAWIDCAERVGKDKPGPKRKPPGINGPSSVDMWWESQPDEAPDAKRRKKQFRTQVREWAVRNGHHVPERGRLSSELVDAYQRAHGTNGGQ